MNIFLQKEKNFDVDRAIAALSADRCCLYIEHFKTNKIALDSEHFLIALIAVFPHNFVVRDYLADGYSRHLKGLKELLVRNVAKSVPPFTGAKMVIDYFIKHGMIIGHATNIYILIYNLMICHLNYFLVLEDTDSIDRTLMISFKGVVDHHA